MTRPATPSNRPVPRAPGQPPELAQAARLLAELLGRLRKLTPQSRLLSILAAAGALLDLRVATRTLARRHPVRRSAARAAAHLVRLARPVMDAAATGPVTRLTTAEREIVLLLAAATGGTSHRGLPHEPVPALQDLLASSREQRHRVRAWLGRGARLERSGLLAFDRSGTPRVTHRLCRAVASGRAMRPRVPRGRDQWLQRARQLAFTLRNHQREAFVLDRDDEERHERRVRSLVASLWRGLRASPRWRLTQLLEPVPDDESLLLLVLLIARDAGWLSPEESGSDELLARLAGTGPSDSMSLEARIAGDGALAEAGLIVREPGLPVGRPGQSIRSRAAASLSLLEVLGITLDRVALRRSRSPVLSMSQLVLSGEARQAVEQAVTQVKHRELLFGAWGLSRTAPYGNGMVLLFHGPPGTGKTATAEALASELGCPLLEVRYSEIVQSLAGGTESAIAQVFADAAREDAVLFWDEADALLLDRRNLRNGWEVRDVNVFLVELERFKGTCVLATNQPGLLDPAVDRRVSLKVELSEPDEALREELWTVLLPRELPLDPGVDLAELARQPLTGGQIKNAILDAARRAAARIPRGPVTQFDLVSAARAARALEDGSQHGKLIGFSER